MSFLGLWPVLKQRRHWKHGDVNRLVMSFGYAVHKKNSDIKMFWRKYKIYIQPMWDGEEVEISKFERDANLMYSCDTK